MKISLIFLFLVSITLSLYAQKLPKNQQNAIDQVFAQWDNPNSPGCALAVVQNGKIVFSKGYGMADLEHNLAITPQNVFYIGSVSKQFVTMCMLLLEEEGKINLDDDIHKYFPEMPDYGYPINIRNLIHHTSGIRDYLQLWEMSGRNYLDEIEEEEVLDIIFRQKALNFEPGTRYLYSNSCYFMMAMIVKKITGKSIREYAQEHIFGPLRMKNTQFYNDNRRLIKNRAFGYGEPFEGEFSNMMMRFDLVGSGGIYSTVEDLYLWDQNFYQNKLGKQGNKLIEKMLTNGKYNDGSDIDYAFALDKQVYKGLNTFGHGGALGGYRSQFIQFPDQKTSVIILANLASMNPGNLAFQVADIVLADKFTETTSNETQSEIPAIKLSPKKMTEFEGYYWNNWSNYSRRIYLKDKTLMYWRGENNESELIPIGENRFQMKGTAVPLYVQFESDKMIVQEGDRQPVPIDRYTPISPDADQLKEYSGKYKAAEIDENYQLKVVDGKLVLVLPDAEVPLDPIYKDVFFQGFVGQVSFQRDDSGAVSGLLLDADRVRRMWFERVD
ncbi:MAG: serine hydrolase [Bacteroidetes bacterium]|nr:serine hydrolase [Bacteroidota bacterium]